MPETSPNKKTARIAGLLYLCVVISGIFSLAYVPSKLIVWDNPTETTTNIMNNEFLFRMEILSGIACYVFFAFLPLALYKLLKPVNEKYAKLMVILALISVPLSLSNMTNKMGILSLLTDANYKQTFGIEQFQHQVMFYLEQYGHGNHVSAVFWGLWLFPFGYLVFKSGFLPKVLGVFLMIGCVGYLVDLSGAILFKNYYQMGVSSYITLPASIGEIGICLWLLIFGVKKNIGAIKRRSVTVVSDSL